MAGTHARLSASGAERFMECPGSVSLSQLCEQEESQYAAEGTAAHALAEKALRNGDDAFMYDGEKLEGGFLADAEMCGHVQVYLDYVREQSEGAILLVEHRIEDKELGPSFGGTADSVIQRIVKAGGFVHVVDFKYGAGLPVEAVGNIQMRYYAYGVLRSLGVDKFRGENTIKVGLTIVQPRAPHVDGPIRTEWVSANEIIRWGEEELLPAMARVEAEPETFSPGEHCRFCPAKLICPKLKAEFDSMAEAGSDIPTLDNAPDALLAERYEQIAAVRMYIKAIEDECYKRAMEGSPVAGTKLIYGRSTREWKEKAEDAIIERFGEDAFNEPALKSPAQLEKLPQAKDLVAEWAFKREGKPTLVSSDKPGTPFDPRDAGAGFADIDTPK